MDNIHCATKVGSIYVSHPTTPKKNRKRNIQPMAVVIVYRQMLLLFNYIPCKVASSNISRSDLDSFVPSAMSFRMYNASSRMGVTYECAFIYRIVMKWDDFMSRDKEVHMDSIELIQGFTPQQLFWAHALCFSLIMGCSYG